MNSKLVHFFALVLSGVLSGCSTAIREQSVGYQQPSRSLDPFRLIDYRLTTVKQLEVRAGPPDVDVTVSPGHDELLYYLADDTSVAIETEGGSRIIMVQHGKTVLFQQPWLYVNSWIKR